MIDKNVAKKQVARLSQLRGFPTTIEAMGDMILAVQAADSEEIAVRTLTEFLERSTHETQCPIASELRREIHEGNRRRTGAPRADCERCHGQGFRYEWRLKWREQTSRGFMQAREKRVSSEQEGWDEAVQFPKECEPNVYETTVDCVCRKAKVTA